MDDRLQAASLRDSQGKPWWAVRGSNPRPSRCKRDALPAELTAPGSMPSRRGGRFRRFSARVNRAVSFADAAPIRGNREAIIYLSLTPLGESSWTAVQPSACWKDSADRTTTEGHDHGRDFTPCAPVRRCFHGTSRGAHDAGSQHARPHLDELMGSRRSGQPRPPRPSETPRKTAAATRSRRPFSHARSVPSQPSASASISAVSALVQSCSPIMRHTSLPSAS